MTVLTSDPTAPARRTPPAQRRHGRHARAEPAIAAGRIGAGLFGGNPDLLDLVNQCTVELFAGPGGWDEGARMLGLDLGIEGIEWNKDAAATATAAGHRRRVADVRTIDPLEYAHCTGLIASPPCPTFADSGNRSGLGRDYQRVLDVWTSIGWGIPPLEAMADLDAVQDPRTALLATAGVWALSLPNLEWLAFEQVPAVEYAWTDLLAELRHWAEDDDDPDMLAPGWEWDSLALIDAADLGVPSRRKRVFLVARRYDIGQPLPQFLTRPDDAPTMAQALGWDEGHRMVTRGNRRPTGGNAFACDGPSWCLTGRARSWERDDGLRLTASEAGVLSGFRPDYPWTGSRTSQFQQAGDVVSPVVAAHVLGAVHGVDARAVLESREVGLAA